ncbi:hypothetical protein CMI47_01265, partial [Candidatus Pacearchaeota archaeon]|nr:hypothetical protein [Candidatus Pacearchaeota archaeon]
MIPELQKNIELEIEMLREISNYSRRIEFAHENEQKLLLGAISSLRNSMKIINDSIPELLRETGKGKRLPSIGKTNKVKTGLEKISFKREKGEVGVTLSAKNREKFLKELSLSESFIKKLKKRGEEKEEKFEEFKAARGYLKLSNRVFLNTAIDMINKGRFKPLALEIKKANIAVLFETYVAMMLFTSFLSIFVGLLLTVFLIFFSVHLAWPLITVYSGSYLIRIAQVIWIPFVIPIATFLAIYFYPNLEKKSIGGRINQELPFAVIHMSAISGSGIAPAELFKIIGLSKEYPYLQKEIRKVMNQINLYGYDLVTALNNVAKTTPSEKLAELFAGLSTTITSGADLSQFFDKRSETLLVGYRIDREKYAKTAETFMDIYISVVIA